MSLLIVTNNNRVYEKYKEKKEVLLLEDAGYLQVLEKARDFIHKGAKLLTHPMASSLKPNQTPYRSVMLDGAEVAGEDEENQRQHPDMDSLLLIENSIEAAKQFLADRAVPDWPPKIKEDFKTVDLSIIDSAIK